MSAMSAMSTDLTTTGGPDPANAAGLVPIMTVQQALARYRQLQEIARDLLTENHDYGVIPGTESKDGKPPRKVLLQPGAEKLSNFFGLRPVFLDAGSTRDFERGLFDIRIECVLLLGARREWPEQGGLAGGRPEIVGTVVATAVRSANSREKKYRRGARICPVCNAATIARGKFPKGNPKWYCGKRDGGCGAEFEGDDARILEQSPTLDPLAAADLVNTLEGMAQKRALVAAVRLATNASDLFDVGLDENDDQGEPDEPPARPAAEKREAPAARVGPAFIDGMLKCLAEHGLSLALVLEHYKINNLTELPVSKADDARQKCKSAFAGWREPEEAPMREPGEEG